jgi:hypothetical protein
VPSKNTPERVPILAFIGVAIFIWCMFVIFNPEYTPAFVQPIDAWMRAHPLAWPVLIIAIAIVDFTFETIRTIGAIVLAVEGIDKKVDSLAKDVDELSRRISQ